ncbi:TonB-dependent outer membrane receptor protein [Novosphingobium sp. Rr 2-17]|uniref:TonB-dependent receptor n=1 Tax=Novosphingobium sp. Rr 2-17 TaxID=555793 RepID=UPI0002699C12|nr:TonB-dependent receptor [Novosphingobium sp. Rr 2-17]EIZ77425.1 TonB-dependent outer membrane receptor protein [Novosphingobium sp. Rr 2-17]
MQNLLSSDRRSPVTHRHALCSALALALLATSGTAHADANTTDAKSADTANAGNEAGSILVTGHQQTVALEQKKLSVATTDVMSAEEIESRPGGNIVDILSHLPGLTGYSDMGLGQAATGEKEFVTIRGIDASYNAYTMNGIQVPTADFSTRALSLKLMAPYGINRVTVTKTPTADMPGDSIGGVIDIATPTAFDYDGPFNKLTIAGTLSGKAADAGLPAGGGIGQFEFARRFGTAHEFGIYATVYYDKRSSYGSTLESIGYEPTSKSDYDADGNAISNWRELSNGLTSTGLRSDLYRYDIKRYGGNFSLDYRGDRQTLYLRGTYGRYERKGTDSQHGLFSIANTFDEEGNYEPIGLLSSGYYQSRDENSDLATIQAGGSTTFADDRLVVSYDASVGRSKWERPKYIEASLYGQYITDGTASFDASDPSSPAITYSNDAAREYANNQNSTAVWKFQGSDSGATNTLYSGKIDAAYKVGGSFLDTIKAGVAVNVSKRTSYEHYLFHNNGNFVILDADGEAVDFTNPQGSTVAELSGKNVTDMLGTSWKLFDRSYFESMVLPYAYTSQYTASGADNPGTYTPTDYSGNTVHGTEKVFAGYTSADMHWGKLQAVAGLRLEYTDFRSSHWTVDDSTTGNGHFDSDGNTYVELLPSLNLVWRPQDQLVLRASIHRGFSRPAFGLIAGATTYSTDDITGAVYTSKSNPNLKPTESYNYDLGAEYYGNDGTLLTMAAYYKAIDNFIYTSTATGSLPDSNYSDDSSYVTMPENGKKAELYGVEFNFRRRLKELPGLLSGISIGANATLQHSSADSGRADHYGRKTWLPRAPRYMYNLDLGYQLGKFKTNLAWQHVGEQLYALTSNNLDLYLQPTETLDLNSEVTVGRVTIAAQVQNLLNKVQFYKTLGKSTQYLGTQSGGGNGSYVETGRFFKLSASYQW